MSEKRDDSQEKPVKNDNVNGNVDPIETPETKEEENVSHSIKSVNKQMNDEDCNKKYDDNQLSFVHQSTPPKDSTQQKSDSAVLYDGSDEEEEEEDEEEMGYKMIFDRNLDEASNSENASDVEIEVRGVRYSVPYSIPCHLCHEMMNLCIRRTRYRGQQRDYPAYRCTRKGCQTFRSIRKVFGHCLQFQTDKKSEEEKDVVYQLMPPPPPSPKSIRKKEYDEVLVQRVSLPRHVRRSPNFPKTLSISERMRKANQERSLTFSEFSAQLRRDIAANKRVRARKQFDGPREDGGTLLYITKELTPNEIIELQDVVIQALMNMRKIPVPMTIEDLPLFSHCPWPKRLVESGMLTELGLTTFCDAFSRAPQPPLPLGFIRRHDETLIYRNPKPFEVPDHLLENAPSKVQEDIMNYQMRKEELEARRCEMRFAQKKGLNLCNPLKRGKAEELKNGEKRTRRPTIQELLTLMENQNEEVFSGEIRPSKSGEKRMQWIDSEVSNVLGSDEKKEEEKISEMYRNTMSNPENIHLNQMNQQPPKSPAMFGGYQFNQSIPQNAYFLAPPSLYNQMDSEGVYMPQGFGQSSEYTYVNPHSGAHLTDPSAFLTSFIPSPVTKAAPIGFDSDEKIGLEEEKEMSLPTTSTIE